MNIIKSTTILYAPFVIHVISSIVLVILFHKYTKTNIIIPQISQTGMKIVNKTSYLIYLVSFLIIGIITSSFYINYIYLEDSPILSRIIICIGLLACFLNIIQGYYSLDTHKLLHENTAYGGIFLHLIALSLWIYITPAEKYKQMQLIKWCVILSWISIVLMGPLMMINFNLASIAQRACVLFLLLSLIIFAYYN